MTPKTKSAAIKKAAKKENVPVVDVKISKAKPDEYIGLPKLINNNVMTYKERK